MSTDNNNHGASPMRPLSILAAAAVVLIAGGIWLTSSDPNSKVVNEDIEATQRPTGAGTNPDGVIDERMEGLTNTTETEQFIDRSTTAGVSQQSRAVTDGPGPETNARNVEPAAGDADPAERMIDGEADTQ